MNIVMKQYIVDAFTTELFKGNQAAVCVMSEWIPDSMMRNIAVENNFSETAFTVNGYHKSAMFRSRREKICLLN